MLLRLQTPAEAALLGPAWRGEGAARAETTPGEPVFAGLVGVFILFAIARGGSSADTLAGGIVNLCAIPLLAVALWRLVHAPRAQGWAWPVLVLAAAFALGLAQLVPLPSDVWAALAGRETVVKGYAAAGMPAPALALSLTPDQTRAAVMGLIPPAAVLIALLTLGARSRLWLAGAVATGALASVVLGMAQLAGGVESPLRIYEITDVHAAVGVFANRNHQGAFLAIALPLLAVVLAAAPAQRGPQGALRLILGLALAGTLVVGVAAAMSRAGAALAVLGAIGAWLASGRLNAPEGKAGAWVIAGRVGLGLLSAAALLLAFAFTGLADRFGSGVTGELRAELVPAVIEAGRTFAPFGSGLGSFKAVYPMFEPVERVSGVFINHAHNDYVEVWLECGWAGLAIAAAFGLWWAARTFQVLRSGRGQDQALALAGAIVTGLLLAHSALDYPLRTPALAVVFAVACALMTSAPVVSKK
jgi:O-antigen ligase